jgi:hypothetical protein
MQTVGILLPQTVWVLDFFAQMVTGQEVLGIASYMFEFQNAEEFFLRALSSFHLWLPFLLVWMVWKLGYDKRALLAQTLSVWVLLPVSLLLPPGPAPENDPLYSVNINWVYGFGTTPQTFGMPHWLYFSALMLVFPLLLYAPAHLLLRRLFQLRDPRPTIRSSQAVEPVP